MKNRAGIFIAGVRHESLLTPFVESLLLLLLLLLLLEEAVLLVLTFFDFTPFLRYNPENGSARRDADRERTQTLSKNRAV